MGWPVLAVPTLLLCSALASCAAQPSACPGYFDQGQGAARLSYEAIIPPDHLLDIFTPQRFTELLGELVDGLQLEVLRVESNVTVGGYGQLWEVPLSTADGRSLYDASIQYPWSGEARLVLFNMTGPLFGLDQLPSVAVTSSAGWTTPLEVPNPEPKATQAAAQFNEQAAAAGDWKSYAALQQMMLCNASWPLLVFQDANFTSADVGWLSLRDVVERSPALAPLFPDAANRTEPLQMDVQPAYIRQQTWPLLRDGQTAGLLVSSTSFASQEDALEGRDAVSGYMRVQVNTALYGGPGNQAPIGEAAMRDVETLMTALQQQV